MVIPLATAGARGPVTIMSLPAEADVAPWEKLRELSESGKSDALESFVDSLGSREAIRAIFRLDARERDVVLRALSPAEAADLIEEMPDEHAADLIERLPAAEAAAIVTELRSDDRADVLGDMDEESAAAILEALEPERAEEARRLVSYADDVAGGLMVTEYLSFEEGTTVQGAIENLAKFTVLADDAAAQQAYVVSSLGVLLGEVALGDLFVAKRPALLISIMKRIPSVFGDSALEELQALFEEHELRGIPVVDEHNRLIGVVSNDGLAGAIAERADLDQLKSRGIVGGDEIRSMPFRLRAGRRLSWLSLNIVLNVIAASVIALHEETLAAVIVLAVFLPIVSDMSGCSGNQAVGVSLRELALGIVRPYDFLRVWFKEATVGVVNGLALGLLLGGGAWLWKGNPYLGLVVGGALWLNTIVAVSIGGTVPLALKRFGIDPAVASGPILTTVTDMLGFLLVLTLAAALMPLLVTA